MPYHISEERRDWYRRMSARSRQRKIAAGNGALAGGSSQVNTPNLDPETLMPALAPHRLRALSLFSGGGGLDLGFERAGFEHVASFDILDICRSTLRQSRPAWTVFGGQEGDVQARDWSRFRGQVDVVHGGPPCQPFSIAGKRHGSHDPRDMWPAFIDAVHKMEPAVFLAENVPGLLDSRFSRYVSDVILKPLSSHYQVSTFRILASDFGVPQVRKRVFFVGFRRRAAPGHFRVPAPTHRVAADLFDRRERTTGARAALGLPDIGFDCCAPTIRSGFTGPRKSTSILNSKASQAVWARLKIWPNGVQRDREAAAKFPPENCHFRLAVQDCALLQGFPESWRFAGAAYQVIGQIGNSVCPPVAYAIAKAVARALGAPIDDEQARPVCPTTWSLGLHGSSVTSPQTVRGCLPPSCLAATIPSPRTPGVA